MTHLGKPSRARIALHIVGRAAAAVAIGWAYLGAIAAFDLGGLRSWAAESPYGPLVEAQAVALVAVMFGVTGARIGWRNMVGEARVKQIAAEAANRREQVRSMGGALR